ncbi:MAG: MFS transporter [Methanobacterium sp.]|uniref:MFS transporter n=1 Tax=Methanobacterium sp. TaxID=2164 RepID=UPI003C71DB46
MPLSSNNSKTNTIKGEGRPKAVWAVFFASIIAFMGLGLVDPILPAIASQLKASPSEVTLLFTSYNAIMAIAMLVTGAISSRLGIKNTLLIGMVIIAVFSTLGGLSNNVWTIIGLRGGWGLGNALFVATALTAIVTLSKTSTAKAVILYEAAIGLGLSIGPLLGGLLGDISWRYPFIGVGLLMSSAFILLIVSMTKSKEEKTENIVKTHTSILDPIRALKHRPIRIFGITAFLYNFGFFTILAYAPFVIGLNALGIGLVFVGWGSSLAITSVFIAPKLIERFGTIQSICVMLTIYATILLVMGIWTSIQEVIIISIILSGAVSGTNNTLITTAVMKATSIETSTASAAYSFLRFIGAAIAPALAGILAAIYSPHIPFIVASVFVFGSVIFMFINRHQVYHVDRSEAKIEEQLGSSVLKVKDFMVHNVISVKENTSIGYILKLLVENHIDGVPVVDNYNNLIGIVSDGDIIRYLSPKDEFFLDFVYTILVDEQETEQRVVTEKINKTVANMMHQKQLYTVKEDDTFENALRILSHHHFKQLPVLDLENKVIGIITRGDIIKTILNNYY